MLRSASIIKLSGQINQLITVRARPLSSNYSTIHSLVHRQRSSGLTESSENQPYKDGAAVSRYLIGENISRKDRISFLINLLMDLGDDKEAIYGALDAWVAWERNFPIGPLKNVLLALEKEQQWHRIVQVIKWILSKGQGTTRGTYGQLIRALDMDHRAKEAHDIWMKKLASDLHSVPWKLCDLMISIYYRNNMLEDLVKLFKGLEAFDRKRPEKSIVQKVANAYEMLGLPEEKERILEKYEDLFTDKCNDRPKKSGRASSPSRRKSGQRGIKI
ncbi:pentatricopeptide repeat-containing protein At4g18975, chloroplastic [Olea europaea var. sylvestris]|uniref:pentatricopeptide repeat-containing protein At4g18975, chloroplastic n=1 Tax=Olea europaea var. sylvestris TaxID=158386 RepID=UPI000C1D52F9|nr:pentatricopeptide repeat-containing protein At4g18975, chloroplastic [Olea europaea var. sylvestris]